MAGQIISRGKSTWLVRMSLGCDASAKRRYFSKTIKGTKKDAERFLNKILREKDTGSFVEPSSLRLTELLTEWIDTVKSMSVSPRTLDDYRYIANSHLIPALGSVKLAQLSPSMIQRHYASLQEKLSGRSIRYVHSVLHGALEHAVWWQYLATNPTNAVTLPRKDSKEMRSLTPEECIAFLDAARGDRFEALWFVLLTGGLRPGEALALTWSDLFDGELRVQRSLSRRQNGQWMLKEPKTPRARRVVSLPHTCLKALQHHRTKQVEERLRAGPRWIEGDLIFTNNKGEPLDWRLLARRHFRPLTQKAKISSIRPYDLRHSCATLLLSTGENVKVVSERLGHHSASLTLDTYAHVLPGMGARSAEKLESLLFERASRAVGD